MNDLSTFFFQNLDSAASNLNDQSDGNAQVTEASKSDPSQGLRPVSKPVEETTINPSVLNTLDNEDVDFFNKFLGFTTQSAAPSDPQVDVLSQMLGIPAAPVESTQNPDNLDYLFGDEAEDSNTSNSSSLDLDRSEASQEAESKAPELYRSTSSSTPGSHGDHSSELSSAPTNSFKDYQQQQYNIPPLQVFTRPLGMEDDSLVEHSPRVSQMMRYPDEIPIVTLGRGKKNTRSLIEMSEGEMEEALHGLNQSQSRQAKQQQAIKEWNGACQSALTNEMPPQHQDWNSKNKLHLTVNTAPDNFGQLNQQALNHSIRQQYSLSGNGNPVMEGVMMAPPRSAPPEIRHHTYNYHPNQNNGMDHPNVTLALPTPPLSAGITSSSNLGFDFSSYGMLSAPGHMGSNSVPQPLTRSFSDYGAVPSTNIKSPSNFLNVGNQYIQMQQNHKRDFEKSSFGQPHLNNSLALPTPPLSAGLTSATSLDFFDFSDSSMQGALSHLGSNNNLQVNMASTTTTNQASVPAQPFQSYSNLPLRSNLNNAALTGQFQVQENQSRTRTISFGVEENPIKRRAIDPTQSENLATQIALKPKLIGSRLKPGPKAKSTIVQHPPIQSQGKLIANGIDMPSLPKDVIRCLYTHVNQMGEDGKMIKNYVCQIEGCGRIFPRKTAIESHIQTHLEDKPFVCPVLNCNAAFVRQHDLRRHEHIHSGNKPFRCECNKGFARGDALMRHRQRGICIGSTIPRRC